MLTNLVQGHEIVRQKSIFYDFLSNLKLDLLFIVLLRQKSSKKRKKYALWHVFKMEKRLQKETAIKKIRSRDKRELQGREL